MISTALSALSKGAIEIPWIAIIHTPVDVIECITCAIVGIWAALSFDRIVRHLSVVTSGESVSKTHGVPENISKNLLPQGNVTVKTGDRLKRGDTLGQAGVAPLHYEVRVNDIPVDPVTYILEK